MLVLALGLAAPALLTAHPALARPKVACPVANAAGPAAPSLRSTPAENWHIRKKPAKRKQRKKRHKKPIKLSLQPDSQSANRIVNLGDDREPEEVTLRVSASPRVPPGYGRRLEVAAEPFITSSETGDTVTSSEPTFSRPEVSGNRKRVTFRICIDAPNDLPAGKYVSTLILEGPPSVEAAVMTLTLNAKDGGGFLLAALASAAIAFFILLYKGAGERRSLQLEAAKKLPEGTVRDDAVSKAEQWHRHLCSCIHDLGWLVPTFAAIVSAFAVLYAAYTANPAWGEGGFLTNAIALVGTSLAAVGAKAVFTQTGST